MNVFEGAAPRVFLPELIPLAVVRPDGWHAGIGDPTAMGWITVAAYFVGAALAAGVCRRLAQAPNPAAPRETRFWWLLFGVLVFLGVNKQLDLQTLLTEIGRNLARAQGWFQYRRAVQAVFVVVLAACGLAAYIWVWRSVRDALRPCALALAGLWFLGCFVLIRAASFHHVDVFLSSGPGRIRMNWVLELGGIAITAAGALHRLRTLPRPARPATR